MITQNMTAEEMLDQLFDRAKLEPDEQRTVEAKIAEDSEMLLDQLQEKYAKQEFLMDTLRRQNGAMTMALSDIKEVIDQKVTLCL